MKKTDYIIVAVLLVLLFNVQYIDQKVFQKYFHPEMLENQPATQPTATITNQPPGAISTDTALRTGGAATNGLLPQTVEEAIVPVENTIQPLASETSTANTAEPETTHLLENDHVVIETSDRGGTIIHATLKNYRKELDKESGPKVLDFSAAPALAYKGVADFSENNTFEVVGTPNPTQIVYRTQSQTGVALTRTLTLQENYSLTVHDQLENSSATPLLLPKHHIAVGRLQRLPNIFHAGSSIGVDTLYYGSNEVEFYGKQLSKWGKKSADGVVQQQFSQPVEWVATKNKFFTNILSLPESDLEGASAIEIYARYNRGIKAIEEVGAGLSFNPVTIEANTAYSRKMYYYVGPKKYDILKQMPNKQSKVMEFGLLAPISKFLLSLLTIIHDYIPPYNYGLAIILLTVIVRMAFWPLTHKSTESMKRMQELAPQMKELREKHKDNPQRQQQELMALYKKHKVNPLGGCLPMLVQFPVFIALFYLLRSAVELRFAEFLWISDLSEPEGLLKGMIPIGLNVLPFAMAGTMLIQQRLTPTAGDPMQQKIMQFMPIMLLVFMYNMPSGLLLYWTTSNLLMILQMRHRNKKSGDDPETQETPEVQRPQKSGTIRKYNKKK